MHTRISRLADKTMEATILVAVLAIPLFLNPYSARVFEGEKVGLLRALATIAAAAWLVRYLEARWIGERPSPRRDARRHTPGPSLREQPALLAALLMGLVTLIAGVASISPRLSLWGSYQRGQGILTTLSYLVLFFVTLNTFSHADRRRRLISTLLVASAPVTLLAVIQFAGLDPLPLRSLEPSRVYGTLSNPIFLGAYLVMLIPLTLSQIVRYAVASAGLRWGGLLGYVALLALQLAAAFFSSSRGPVLGVLAGVFLFLFLWALLSRRRWIAGGLLSVAIIGVLVLTVLALPNTPLESLRGAPVIGRFSQIMESGSARVRVLIWESVVDRFAGQPDRLALGFGPESTQAALLPTYQPQLRHLEPERLPDRAHSLVLETLVTTGMAGVISVLLLFTALFYTGLRSLGLVETPRLRNRWLALIVAGVGLGALIPRLAAGDWTFAGLGVALGMAAALVAFLISLLWGVQFDEGAVLSDRSILIAGVLAALAGHLVEASVGIRVTTTESVFWVLAGLLVVLSFAREKEAIQAPGSQAGREPGGITLIWNPEVAALGLLGGVMLSTLAFSVFLLPGASVPTSVAGRWALLIGAWALAGPLWLGPPDASSRPGTGWLYPLVSLVWAVLFIALRTVVPTLGGDALTLLNLYALWMLTSLVVIVALLPRRPAEKATSPVWLTPVYAALGVVVLGLVALLFVKPLYADIYLEAAQSSAEAGQWPEALAFYRQAAEESANVDVYQQNLGEAYATAAHLTQDAGERNALFQAGRQAFQQAVTLNPANAAHRFNLAHLYLLWGQATSDAARRTALLDQAANLYQRAASEMPMDPRVWVEWGQVLQAQGNADAALEKFGAALELDPRDAQAYFQMGILYHRSGKTEQAMQMYQQAIELEPDRPEAYRALADLYRVGGRLVDAVTAQQRAAELQPTDYTIHQNLALLYRDLGQIQNAVAEARLALRYAPPDQQPALQGFIQSLLASSAP
ncbi:MAG: tetratricopeptide repeat protein [Anaerolineae bacterium]